MNNDSPTRKQKLSSENIHTNGNSLLLLPPVDKEHETSTVTLERSGEDVVDAIPKTFDISIFDIFVVCVSMVTFLFDVSLDIVLACYYYSTSQWWYFYLTTAFIVIPGITMSLFSFYWYLDDSKSKDLPKPHACTWIVRSVCLILLFAPVLRYFDSFRYGVISRQKAKLKENGEREKYYFLMVYEDGDASLLRLFECFMEAAPQVILQVYILINDESNSTIAVGFKLITISTSLLSMAWALTSYHRTIRFSQNNKKNISWQGTIVQFIWHFFTVTSRVLVLALFTSVFPIAVGPVCLIHWMIMSCWLISQETNACSTKYAEYIFDMFVAIVYIFCFINAKEESTRQNLYKIYFKDVYKIVILKHCMGTEMKISEHLWTTYF